MGWNPFGSKAIAENIVNQFISSVTNIYLGAIQTSSTSGVCINSIFIGKDCKLPTDPEKKIDITQNCYITLKQDSIADVVQDVVSQQEIESQVKQLAESVSQNFSFMAGDAKSCNIYKAAMELGVCISSSVCQSCVANLIAENKFECTGGTYKGNVIVNMTAFIKDIHKCIMDSNQVVRAKSKIVARIEQEAKTVIMNTIAAMLFAIALIMFVFFVGKPVTKGVVSDPKKRKRNAKSINMFIKIITTVATILLGLVVIDCQWIHKYCVPVWKNFTLLASIIIYGILLIFFMIQKKT